MPEEGSLGPSHEHANAVTHKEDLVPVSGGDCSPKNLPPVITERIDYTCLFQACLIVWGSDGQRKEVGCAVPSSGIKSKHFLTGICKQMG